MKLAQRCARFAAKSPDDPTARDALMARMDAAEEQRSLLYEDLVLLGTEPAVEAANEVNRYLWTFMGTVRKQGPNPIDFDLDPRSVDLLMALSRFHDCARADLGIRGLAALVHPPSGVDPASVAPKTPRP